MTLLADAPSVNASDAEISAILQRLSGEDLRHLAALRDSEPEIQQLRERHELQLELQRAIRRLLHKMPTDLASIIDRELSSLEAEVVLCARWDAIYLAKHGVLAVPTIGAYLRNEVAA